MTGGALGSASFSLVADNDQLLGAFVQSQAKAQQASAAIQAAVKAQTTAIQSGSVAAQQASAAQTKAAQGAIQQAQQAQQRYDAMAKSMAASSEQASSGFGTLLKSGVALGTGLAGVTVGVDGVRRVMVAATEATLNQAQAQRQLAVVFQGTSESYKRFADDIAKSTGRQNATVEQGVVRLGTLRESYALTSDVIQGLSKTSLDLAAVFGGDLSEAFKSVQSGVRGEAEEIEKFGIFVQDSSIKTTKAFQGLTEEQKKNWESLSEVTKARVRANAILEQAAKYEGEAEKRTKTQQGSFDRLTRATDEAAKSIGDRLVPALAKAADGVSDYLERSQGVAKRNAEMAVSFEDLARRYTSALGPFSAIGFFDMVTGRGQKPAVPSPAEPSSTATNNPLFGPTADEVQDAHNRWKQAQETAKDALIGYADSVKKAVDKEADAREEAARRSAKAEDDRIERARIGLEVEKAAKEKALEEGHRATIKGIEAEERAAEAASKATIERLEIEKQGRLAAAESARDQALDAIKAKKEQLDRERELEDRATADGREREDQEVADARRRQDQEVEIHQRGVQRRRELEDRDREDRRRAEDQDLQERRQKVDQQRAAARQQEDRDLEAAVQRSARRREQEDRDRHDLRAAEDAQIADRRKEQDAQVAAAQKGELDALEATHAARLKAIEDEIRAVGDRKDATLRALDEEADRLRADAEQASRVRDAAHERTLRALDAEAQAARTAAEQDSRVRATAHETTLRLIDAQADAHRRAADVVLAGIKDAARAEDDRHRAAVQAIDDEKARRQDAIDAQIAALDALDQADGRAAEDRRLGDAVTNARFGLKKAESTGNQSEIVKAQQDLDNALAAIDRTRVQRERDAARDVLKARKDAIQEEADLARRAEDERNRQLDRALQDAQENERALLQSVLDRLAAQKQAEDDRYAQEQRSASDALDLVMADIERRKVAEQDAYAAAKLAAQDALDAQLAAIAKRKLAVSDESEAALRRLRERQDVEKAAYDKDVERIKARYQTLKDNLAAERLDEDRHREARRLGEDRDLADHRKKEDERLVEDKKRVADRRLAEDQALDAGRLREDTQRANRRTAEDRDRTDRRTAEDQQFKEAGDRLAELRLHEDRDRKDRRTEEDRQRQDYRTAEDLKLSAQQVAVQKQFEDERTATEAHYNGPNGVITQVRKAMEDAKEAYRLRKEDAELKFSAERAALALVYRSPDKQGLLDLQDQAAENNRNRLADQLKDIEKWKKDANTWIDENKGKWKDLEGAIRSVSGAITGLPNGGRPPAGTGGTGGPNAYGNEATGQRYRLPSGQEVELGSVGGSVAPNQQIPNPPADEVERFIRQVAPQYGVPADDAVRVWSGEGRSAYVGDSGTSFGPYQLHVGGGLGNEFANLYKLDPRDPATWREQVMYTMAYVQVHGWNGQWHGAPPDLMNKRYADGGWVDRASWLVDQETGRRWGSIAEGGRRELVVPEHRVPAMYAGADTAALSQGRFVQPLSANLPALSGASGLPSLTGALPAVAAASQGGPGTLQRWQVDLMANNQVIESFWFEGYRLNARRGGLPSQFGDVP